MEGSMTADQLGIDRNSKQTATYSLDETSSFLRDPLVLESLALTDLGGIRSQSLLLGPDSRL